MGRLRFSVILAVWAVCIAAPARAERMPSASDTRAVWQALSTAPEAERAAWRWRLARDYVARGLYAEAEGVLRVLAADTPERANARDFRLLHAEALTALGEAGAALALLDTPVVEGLPVTCLRRLAASAQLQQHAAVRANLACAEPALKRLGDARRASYLMAGVRAEVALGNDRIAESLLSRVAGEKPAQAGEAEFWRGVIARRRGQTGLATDHFQKAAAGPNPVAVLRARIALAEIKVASGASTPKAARAQLSTLQHSWRGGVAERDLLMALGRLSDQMNDQRAAFAAYGTAALYLPRDPSSPPLAGMLAARFAQIFADGGQSLAPVAAFALFWDYREFAPQGPAADAMVRRLADRLAALGLGAQAASLLEHQVYNRLEGTARGVVAVKLAALLTDSGHYVRALGVLTATRRDGIPDELRSERNLIEAKALIGAGRAAEAKALIGEEGDAGALKLRAEVAWAARDWAAVIDLLVDELPAADADVAPVAVTDLLRVAVAAAMDGDEALLRRLHRDYAAALSRTDVGAAFEVLTGEPGTVPPGELRAALADAAKKASLSQPMLGKAA